MSQNPKSQLESFKAFLKEVDAPPTSPLLQQFKDWLTSFPETLSEEDQREVSLLLKKAFHLKDEHGGPPEPFEELIPKHGWLRDYYEFTLQSEAPAVFHFMSALTILGASLERQVYFDKGIYRLYPNVATVLIAPTGRCRKTSATNIALGLARAVDVNVLADRLTPEALVEGLHGRECAAGLVYAAELAVFLGRSKYLEGMVPLLTSLFDCPDRWTSKTIGRGEATLANVALSLLVASTLEWFMEALPREVFSGGFMSRILFVVQEDTDREFALPKRGEGQKWEKLREDLQELKALRGEAHLVKGAKEWYTDWYHKHKKMPLLDEKFAGYHERKPDHVLRMAMLMRIAEAVSLEVHVRHLEEAIAVLDWMEKSLPNVFETVAATPVGEHHQRILRQLRQAPGGEIPHSVLLKKNQHAMNARTFFEAILTLKESKSIVEVRERNVKHSYKIV